MKISDIESFQVWLPSHGFGMVLSGWALCRDENSAGINVRYTDTGCPLSLLRAGVPSSCFRHKRCSPTCVTLLSKKKQLDKPSSASTETASGLPHGWRQAGPRMHPNGKTEHTAARVPAFLLCAGRLPRVGVASSCHLLE